VAGAVNLLVQSHPINSALSLIAVMASLAVEYLLLGAEFLNAVQIIVYAGAVMVLFIITIMLLNAGEEERSKAGRRYGEAPKLAPGALPMFKPAAKPISAEGVGKYAIKFTWNDDHDLGIYSWKLLRELCPCEECKAARAGTE